jgi:hypothetical protein
LVIIREQNKLGTTSKASNKINEPNKGPDNYPEASKMMQKLSIDLEELLKEEEDAFNNKEDGPTDTSDKFY